MKELEANNYVPPFVTETDEKNWDDCTVCSTLMATAAATTGETVSNKNWRPKNSKQLKRLRERIRNHLGPGNQTGGTTMADMRVAFKAEYPWLPKIPSYVEQQNTWKKARNSLLSGWGGVYMGNPALVTNKNSGLRRWTNNDNFGHAIWVDRARETASGTYEFYVMDPLGSGSYDGEWIAEEDLSEFTWFYNKEKSWRYITLFERGAWNIAARSSKTANKKLAECQKKLKDCRAI